MTGIEHHRWKRKNQPVRVELKDAKTINANAFDTEVNAAMANLDAEYEALVAEFASVSV